MKMEVLDDADAVARRGAVMIAGEARSAIAARGCFILAVSGGQTPWKMLRALAGEALPWERVHVAQVDERVAPEGHSERNLTHVRECLIELAPLRPEHIHAMPVDREELDAAATVYGKTLAQIAGAPAVIDLVHLGLGSDGHTASLVPGDTALGIYDRDVAITGVYQGRRRMTLTYPALNRSRRILWVVTGADKAPMMVRLRKGDVSIPAGRVQGGRAWLIADRAAAGG